MTQVQCHVCFRACLLSEGQTGACLSRAVCGGRVVPLNYGLLTSIALDPIEKKPLNRFLPGTKVLSVGSFGCNLKCAFCQNCEISQAGVTGRTAASFPKQPDGGNKTQDSAAPVPEAYASRDSVPEVCFTSADGATYRIPVECYTPEELRDLALQYRDRGNIGIAYTYNEPLTGYEFVRDTARLVHGAGMKNVLVTAGCVSQAVLEEVLPYIDAMNIDLKSFNPAFYETVCGGSLDMVKAFIETAARHCHVELTTLIVPGENDTEEETLEIAAWIAGLNDGKGREIPYHISRFFPRYRMRDRSATGVSLIYRLADVARGKLQYVYTGNC